MSRSKFSLLVPAVIVCGVGIVFFTIWARIGVLPAASAGDDIWFNESGYYLMTEGVLRRPMHDDFIGSSYRDFLPPIPGAFMAAAFSLFGLTQFADGLPGALAITIAIIVFAVVIQRLAKLPYLISLATATAFLFLPQFIKLVYQNRYEPYVLMFLSLSLLFGSMVRARQRTQIGAIVLSGMCAGAACASHYPVAPYVWGLAALAVYSVHGLRAGVPFAIGTGLAGLAGIAWVWPDFGLFFQQLLTQGEKFNLFRMPHDLHAFFASKFEAIVILALASVAIFASRSSPRPYFLWYAFAGALMGFFWWHSLPLYAAVSLVLGLAVVVGQSSPAIDENWRSAAWRKAATWILALLFAGTVVGNIAVAAVSVRERQERDFSSFKTNLRSVLRGHTDGLVLIDRTPHLALREIVPRDRLHNLVGDDQTFIFASKVLFDASAEQKVSAVIVLPGSFNDRVRDFPLVKSFIRKRSENGEKPIQISALGIGDAVVHRGPYHVLVFIRGR